MGYAHPKGYHPYGYAYDRVIISSSLSIWPALLKKDESL